MNRHIERLLESAPYTTISTEGRLFSQQDVAVFAELIVKECCDAALEAQADFYVVHNIKQHFGVEE